jgi:hypothetical protein
VSVTIEGLGSRLVFEVADGELVVGGRGTATVTALTPAFEPPDEPHELSAEWQLCVVTAQNEIPEKLRNSQILRGLKGALEKAAGKDLVAIVPLQSETIGSAETRSQVSVVMLVSGRKFEILYELLRDARTGAERSSFLFTSFGLVELLAARDDDVIEPQTFEQWMKSGNPVFVAADVEFGLAAKTSNSPTESIQPSLQSIQRWLIGLVILTVISLILQCSKS